MPDAPNFVDSDVLDRLPDDLAGLLLEHLGDEPVWGAVETGSSRKEEAIWFIVASRRNALVAVSSDGGWWRDLPLTGEVSVSKAFARQKFLLDGEELFDSSRLTGSRLTRLFELAFLPRAHGLFEAGLDQIKDKSWNVADKLLILAQDHLTLADRAPNIAYLNRAQEIAVRRAQCAMQLGREGEALEFLVGVSSDCEGDDLINSTSDMHGVKGWLITLALAHQEAGQFSAAAKVYARLHADEPGQDLFILSTARALRRAGNSDAAVAAYSDFIDERFEDNFSLLRRGTDGEEESDHVDADPDFVEACLESGELLEELGREQDAAVRYLTLIRHAPFSRDGYASLFRLQDALPDESFAVTLAGEVVRLLDPALVDDFDHLPARHKAVELPFEYGSISESQHDELIVHAGERGAGTTVQRWIGSLTSDRRDTKDIERHACPVDGSKHKQVHALLEQVSAMLEVDPPRLFLSFGSTGIEALSSTEPLVLLGNCHLTSDQDRHLSLRHLAFAFGSQVEHIKAGHLILTSSEFWKTFTTKSATTLLAFLPMGDVVGKFTDSSLISWIKKFKGTTETEVLRSVLRIAEERGTAGAAGAGMQHAYSEALAKVREIALEEEVEDEHSMVKEKLADFARAAQYTADRAGLIACDDLAGAVEAMLRLSPTAFEYAEGLTAEGLRPLLEKRDESGEYAHYELVLRLGELIKFALSEDYRELRGRAILKKVARKKLDSEKALSS